MFDSLFEKVDGIKEGAAQVKKRYVDSGELPEEIFKKFVEGDPTRQKGKYIDWMAKIYVGNPERPDHMVDVIRMFHSMVMRKKIRKTDIYQYGTVDEVEEAAIKAEKKKSKSEVKKDIRKDMTVVLDDERKMIIVPETYEASLKYGMHTKWCTASKSTDTHWKAYYRQGCKLYYIIDKLENKKYAVLVYPNGTKHVYDELDKSISFEELEKKLGL